MSARTEPVGLGGAVMAVVVAVLGLLPLLGVPLTTEQLGGLTLLATAVIGLVTYVQRSKVTPVGGVGRATDNSGDQAEPFTP